MGSACCVAAKDRSIPSKICIESSARNVQCSPSWNVQWDRCSHVEDAMIHHGQLSPVNPRNISLERKSRLEAKRESSSDGASSVEYLRTTENLGATASDISAESLLSNKESAKSSKNGNPSDPDDSVSAPSISSPSLSKGGPLTSSCHSFHSDHTPSRQVFHSPGSQLSWQTLDSQVPEAFNPPTDTFLSEEIESFGVSVSTNDAPAESYGGSSDGWSMRTFSELVTSQRERWSFDSENTNSGYGKITRSDSQLPASLSAELQVCGLCSKLLSERDIFGNLHFLDIAVLFCGHIYHAECLEKETSETEKFDPSCPVCMPRERSSYKVSGKSTKLGAESRSKSNRRQGKGKDGPKMGTSSSMRSTFARPFLRRHFSIGGFKPSRSISENESTSTRRKGFWAKYRNE